MNPGEYSEPIAEAMIIVIKYHIYNVVVQLGTAALTVPESLLLKMKLFRFFWYTSYVCLIILLVLIVKNISSTTRIGEIITFYSTTDT